MAYSATSVDFDGANDYMLRGADLIGSADSKIVSGGTDHLRAHAAVLVDLGAQAEDV